MPRHVQVLDTDGDGFVATLDDRSQVRASSVVARARHGPAPAAAGRAAGAAARGIVAAHLRRRRPLRGGRTSLPAGRRSAERLRVGGPADRGRRPVGGRRAPARLAGVRRGPTGAGSPRWSTGWPPTPAGSTGSRLTEQDGHRGRLWAEGRLKVEPWLEGRLPAGRVRVRPRTTLVGCERGSDGSLDGDPRRRVARRDRRGACSRRATCRASTTSASCARATCRRWRSSDGLPDLDDGFQTSVPGLFVTSLPATAHFGPFFGFTVAHPDVRRRHHPGGARPARRHAVGPAPRPEPRDAEAVADG